MFEFDEKLINILLQDQSSKKNLLWATDNYLKCDCQPNDCINIETYKFIKSKQEQTKEEQQKRKTKYSEITTPSWVCEKQIDLIDETFNSQINKNWQDYVNLICLEITCGEAPYLVNNGLGILERKLQKVSEHCESVENWLKWAFLSVQTVYGYDIQGDKVFLARKNLLSAVFKAFKQKFNNEMPTAILNEFALIISWNIFQMDGLKSIVPEFSLRKLRKSVLKTWKMWSKKQMTRHTYCKIMDWKEERQVYFLDLLNPKITKAMFDVVVGNPPYHLKGASGGKNDAPIYQCFVESSIKLAQNYCSLIIPARWFSCGRENLLNEFRSKMLNNPNIEQLFVYANSLDVFPDVDIKGGVCWFLINKNYEGLCNYSITQNGQTQVVQRKLNEFDILIRDFEISEIVKKVRQKNEKTVDEIVSNDTPFGISSNFKTSKKLSIETFDSETKEHDTALFYIENQKRKKSYVSFQNVKKNKQDIEKFKVLFPLASGSGMDSLVLGQIEFAPKNSVCSQSYLYSPFDTKIEAENFSKYLKTKFLRALVSACKISQSVQNKVFRFVPMQNFTNQSDIDWLQSIENIDMQLYKKYALSDNEVNYIESKIKLL